MNQTIQTLLTFANEQKIPVVRVQRLTEHEKKHMYEPGWYATIVLFDAVTLKRVGVYESSNGKLYFKVAQDRSLIRYGGEAIETVQLPMELRTIIISELENAIIERNGFRETEERIIETTPYE
ncbi:MAG: hypothetical protein ACRC5Q_02075 [Culicoidibacterales bacterium]